MDQMNNKTSADLEREVAEQRRRVEDRIGEIRDRLSPGQLLDEALTYTKHGGAHFLSNLGQQVSANPIPAVLAGVGIAWLVAGNNRPGSLADRHPVTSDADYEPQSYPTARVSGALRRTQHAADEAGEWWSEFQTDAGETFRARSNELGARAGHFTDQAGRMYSGFVDQAGARVSDIRDEAGNRLDAALGWASQTWRDTQQGVSNVMRNAASGYNDLTARAADGMRGMTGQFGVQADQMSRAMTDLFERQPLIAGALAFAAGAAIGAAIPHTPQEDELMGEEADRIRGQALRASREVLEEGKEKLAETYDEARRAGTRVYQDAKESLTTTGNGSQVH
jgi:hypothetical protein